MRRKQQAREGYRVNLECCGASPPVSPRSPCCTHAQGLGVLEAWAGQGWSLGREGVFKPNLARGKEGLYFSPQCAWGTYIPRLEGTLLT